MQRGGRVGRLVVGIAAPHTPFAQRRKIFRRGGRFWRRDDIIAFNRFVFGRHAMARRDSVNAALGAAPREPHAQHGDEFGRAPHQFCNRCARKGRGRRLARVRCAGQWRAALDALRFIVRIACAAFGADAFKA